MVLHPQWPGHAEATQKHDDIALTEAAASRRGRKTKARRKKLQQANAGYYHSPEIRREDPDRIPGKPGA